MKPTAYQGGKENCVQVAGKNVQLSRKVGREIAVFIRGKTVNRAISDLNQVVAGVMPIPYTRHKWSVPHRHGPLAEGRYPWKASKEIIKLLESLKSNAENKALDADSLVVVHAACHQIPTAWHYGRQRRRHRKLAHFEVVGAEAEQKEKKYGKKEAKEEKKK